MAVRNNRSECPVIEREHVSTRSGPVRSWLLAETTLESCLSKLSKLSPAEVREIGRQVDPNGRLEALADRLSFLDSRYSDVCLLAFACEVLEGHFDRESLSGVLEDLQRIQVNPQAFFRDLARTILCDA